MSVDFGTLSDSELAKIVWIWNYYFKDVSFLVLWLIEENLTVWKSLLKFRKQFESINTFIPCNFFYMLQMLG
jgi:hypothetical protein